MTLVFQREKLVASMKYRVINQRDSASNRAQDRHAVRDSLGQISSRVASEASTETKIQEAAREKENRANFAETHPSPLRRNGEAVRRRDSGMGIIGVE
jgi:hypothetical protein